MNENATGGKGGMFEQVRELAVNSTERLQVAMHDISVHARFVGGLTMLAATVMFQETLPEKLARLRAKEQEQPCGTAAERDEAARLFRVRSYLEDVEAGLAADDPEKHEGL